jgi:signal transduction histidine kinase
VNPGPLRTTRSSLVRLFFRAGRGVGIAVLVASLAALAYLRFLAPQGQLLQPSWPTEGYYFAGAQYQLSLQGLRIAVAQFHTAPDDTQRAERRQEALVWRDVLHAKLSILTDSPEMAPYLSAVSGFNEAIGPLRTFDAQLDQLVGSALDDRDGLARFDAAVSDAYRYVLSMVNDLRVAELSAFEAGFEVQRRRALGFLEFGLFLLSIIGLGVYAYVHFARKERAAFKKEAEARAEAQRSAQARAALLGMVSHELRTPLQTMLANVELLSVQSHKSLATDRIADLLLRSIEFISGQLDNIAQYTRLASGPVDARCEEFSMFELLRRIVDEHAEAAKVHEQRINLDLGNEVDFMIHGDPIRLQQVVNNYLSNAIKYARPGRITVAACVHSHRFGTLQVADAVEVTVEDEGPGIPPSDQAAMWEPFVRGKSALNRRKGSGLGLAVVKLLASSVGWEVGVRTAPGHGSTFYVILPLVGPAAPSVPPDQR